MEKYGFWGDLVVLLTVRTVVHLNTFLQAISPAILPTVRLQ